MGVLFMAALARLRCLMGTQAAQNWVLLANLVAVGVYVCLTRRIYQASDTQAKASQDLAIWQRKQWELDTKKEEWRELIGTLTQCFHKMELSKATRQQAPGTGVLLHEVGRPEVLQALLESSGVISDRLFIGDVLDKERVREEWREIELVFDRAGVTDLQQKWVALHRKLVRAARADLGIAGDGLDTGHG